MSSSMYVPPQKNNVNINKDIKMFVSLFMCVKDSSSPVIVSCFLPDVLLNNVRAHGLAQTHISFLQYLVSADHVRGERGNRGQREELVIKSRGCGK